VTDAERRVVILTITGIVQGVGYRAFVARQAAMLDLAGSVRNRRDGSVEAVVAGPSASIDAMIAACWRGPLAAEVRDIQVADHVGLAPTDFTVLPTR
jgi:acylphosphatase